MKVPKIKKYAAGGNVSDKDKKPLTDAEKKHIAAQTAKGYLPYDTSPTDFYDPKRLKITSDPSGGQTNIIDLTTGKPYDSGAFSGRLRQEDIISMPKANTVPTSFLNNPTVIPTSQRSAVGFDASGNTTYKDNTTGQTYTLDKAGNNIGIVEQYNKGGKIPMKALKGIKVKGYLTGGEVTPEEQNQGVYIRNGVKYDQSGTPIITMAGDNAQATSTNTLPLSTGTEFKAQGDVPLTKLDEKGQAVTESKKNNFNAKQAGQMLGSVGSSYYASQIPADEGEAAYNTGMGAVSKMGAIGGAIGGIAAAGDMIGKPVRKNAEKFNTETGRYENIEKAQAGAVVGSALNPFKGLTSVMFDKDASNQQKIVAAMTGGFGAGVGQYKRKEEAFAREREKGEVEKQKIAGENQLNDALAARDRGETGYTAINNYKREIPVYEKRKDNIFEKAGLRSKFAQGGKIVGKGTAKSDSIDAKVNGFVVPAENEKIAAVVRKVVLKKAPSMKANLKQGGGTPVKLSNGEHLFTPKEVEKIENTLGDDFLDKLAPNSANHEDMMEGEYSEMEKKHMKDGGLLSAEKARMMLHDKSVNGQPLTDKQRKFFGWVAGGRKAEGGMVGYSDGGKVPEGTKLGQYYYKNGKWSNGSGNILSKEGAKQYEDAYFKTIAARKKTEDDAYKRDIEESNKANNPNYKSPEKKADAVTTTPAKKYPSAPSVKKNPSTFEGKTNANVIAPQDLALVEQLKNTPAVATTTTTQGGGIAKSVQQGGGSTAQQNTQTSTPDNSSNFVKSWKAWSPQFANYIGSAVETGASLAQIKLGRDALKNAGARPVGQIDPTFQANVDRAQAQSKYGFSAEQNFLINQENQNATNAARFAARNYSGGSGGNAFNMERSAINEGWGRGLAAKVADQNLMLDKQQTANQMSLQKAQMSRQLFDDKLNAWNINQQAGGNLLGAGIRNIVGAGRYASALASINAQNQLGQ